MTNQKPVILCSTLHDPDGVFLDRLDQVADVVSQGYQCWVVNVSVATDQRIKEKLASLASKGVVVTETDQADLLSKDHIEADHLQSLSCAADIARKMGLRKIQYTDGDRIITAASYYPDDLISMADKSAALIDDNDGYVNYRRNDEDFFSHHPPLVQTELPINALYTQVFGIPLDVGSTAHAMSLDVVEEILRQSPEIVAVSYPHAKWIIIARSMGIPIKSQEINHVLTFETPDKYRGQIAERIDDAFARYGITRKTSISPYQQLQRDYMMTVGRDSTVSAREWRLRFNTQRQYLDLLKHHLGIFGFDESTQAKYDRDLTQFLGSMERYQQTIIEALNMTPDEIRASLQSRLRHRRRKES